MESLSRGWKFLMEAWKMAADDVDLIKPSIYTLVTGFFVTIAGAIPFALMWVLLNGKGATSGIVLFLIGVLFIFAHYVVTYVFSAMTVYLVYGYLAEGDGRMEKAWEIVKRDFWDLASLAAASTLVKSVQRLLRGNRKRGGGDFLAGVLGAVWTEAAFLILPAMVIEDISLKDAMQRAADIAKENLLLVGVSAVGVKAVTNGITFLLSLIGAILGGLAARGIVLVWGTDTAGMIIAIGTALVIFFVFFLPAITFSVYTGTAYHTCLYLWARDAERAEDGVPVAAPAPLAAVLG